MSSFTWKRPRDLETPQDLETRYEGADIEPASLAAWRLLMEQLISSADPAIAFIGFLQTMQALPTPSVALAREEVACAPSITRRSVPSMQLAALC